MIVVADTGPLNYLIQIEYVEVLKYLYRRVLVPFEVRDELLHPNSPLQVRLWVSQAPDWCEFIRVDGAPIMALSILDSGERAAIQLALQIDASTVLIDELAGRRLAVRHGLLVRGTLGVLKAASLAGHIDLYTAVARLLDTNFNISTSLLEQIMRSD